MLTQILSEFKACLNFLRVQGMQGLGARCALLGDKHPCAYLTLGSSKKIVGLNSMVSRGIASSFQSSILRITCLWHNIVFHEALWTFVIMRICDSYKVSKGYQWRPRVYNPSWSTELHDCNNKRFCISRITTNKRNNDFLNLSAKVTGLLTEARESASMDHGFQDFLEMPSLFHSLFLTVRFII